MGVEEGELLSFPFPSLSVVLRPIELIIPFHVVQISPIERPGSRLLNFRSHHQVRSYGGFKPFIGRFPFEIVDLISSFVGLGTLASMAATSFDSF